MDENNVKTLIFELFEKVGIEDAEITVEDKEEEYLVTIDAPEKALLIGKHGNTLASLQTVISLMLAKSEGEYKRVILDIGEYRKEREEYLKDLATRFREDVMSSGNEREIRGLKAWERRLIHVLFQEDQEVMTESRGEGRDRVLVIKKK